MSLATYLKASVGVQPELGKDSWKHMTQQRRGDIERSRACIEAWAALADLPAFETRRAALDAGRRWPREHVGI